MIVEETEPALALTPEGNAALVDDFGGNKQLITVTTKAGNYFYILIDRANEDKETAVHFLNQVDDADLAALMEDGKTKEEMPAVCSCSTKCEAGAVNTACPVCATDKSKCTGKAPEPPAETPEPEKEKPAGLNPAALILLLALLGGGGVFAYLKLVKNLSLIHISLLLLLYRTSAKSQGMKQLMAGAGVAVVGMVLVPLLSGLFSV